MGVCASSDSGDVVSPNPPDAGPSGERHWRPTGQSAWHLRAMEGGGNGDSSVLGAFVMRGYRHCVCGLTSTEMLFLVVCTKDDKQTFINEDFLFQQVFINIFPLN